VDLLFWRFRDYFLYIMREPLSRDTWSLDRCILFQNFISIPFINSLNILSAPVLYIYSPTRNIFSSLMMLLISQSLNYIFIKKKKPAV